MSARHACDFSRATAQSNLATTALLDGRFARAAELFGRAVDAAEQATPRRSGAPCDCLVTAYLMAARASALIRAARLKMDTPTLARRQAARAAVEQEIDIDSFYAQSCMSDTDEAFRLAPEAWAILERRRVAGTLLHARPAEEAWLAVRRTFVTAEAAAADEGAAVPHGAAGVGCLLLGYEAVLCLADVALVTQLAFADGRQVVKHQFGRLADALVDFAALLLRRLLYWRTGRLSVEGSGSTRRA